MTNNPTIDGVSRDTIQRAIDVIQQVGYQDKFIDYDLTRNVKVELRALLDAPAVERQEPKSSQVPVLRAMAANYRNGHCWDFLDGEAVSKAADEITFLQSTIARLEARIAELESGWGKPVAWRFLVSSGGDWFTTTKQRVADLYRGTEDGGEVERLFTAPPAPVAVVTDEQQAFANWTHEVIGMRGLAKVQRRDEMTVEQEKYAMKGWLARACLDATAALNGVKS